MLLSLIKAPFSSYFADLTQSTVQSVCFDILITLGMKLLDTELESVD